MIKDADLQYRKRIVWQIWKILTSRKFRYGPLPVESVRLNILESIEKYIRAGLPVRIFQFWGGMKNPNLKIYRADACELTTLKFLNQINDEVRKVYSPGLAIVIFPGDERVHKANGIPREQTKVYVDSLKKIAENFGSLFEVIPVSYLYDKYKDDFVRELNTTRVEFSDIILTHKSFEKLARNAQKNLYTEGCSDNQCLREQSTKAAKTYVIYRLAEERARIFREYEDCIRFAFVKLRLFFSFYNKCLNDIEDNYLHMKRVLHFHTGRKGNITQPWQAKAFIQEKRVHFISQNRSIDRINK